MTATGISRAMGSQGSRSRPGFFSFHSRKRKEGVVRGQLRIKSSPGAYLVLGVVVVIMGVAVATVGYWPYQTVLLGQVEMEAELDQPPRGQGTRGSPFSIDHLKLLGPVLMGVGLFILICANSVLYENRDRETRRLLARAQATICTVSSSVAPEATSFVHALPNHYQWVTPVSTTNLGLQHLGTLMTSEPALLQLQAREGKWADISSPLATLKSDTEPSMKAPSPSVSMHLIHPDSCKSSELNLTVLPTASLMDPTEAPASSPLERNGWVISASPRRCYSFSSRTEPHQESGRTFQKQSSPHLCFDVADLYTSSVDGGMGSCEAQRHYSWPQLDLSEARRYLMLENKEDSVDRLLDQLEQQYSQQEKSYSSGPFQ